MQYSALLSIFRNAIIGTQILKQTPKKWLGWHVLLLRTLGVPIIQNRIIMLFLARFSSLILDMGLFIKFEVLHPYFSIRPTAE